MKYSTSFYLEVRSKNKGNENSNLPIMLSITFEGKRLQYYTGYRCTPLQWSNEKTPSGDKVQQVKRNVTTPDGVSFSEVNRQLDKLSIEAGAILTRLEALGIKPTKTLLRDELNTFLNKKKKETITEEMEFFECYEKYMSEVNVSPGRKKHLNVNMNKLKAFRPETKLKDIDLQYLIDFQNYLYADNNLGKNSAIGQLKLFRTFVRYAYIKRDWIKSNPFDKFEIEQEIYGDPVYLTLEERDILYNTEVHVPHLERVRDIFVFQCLIGCRVGDLVKLTKANIIDDAIEYIAAKTKDNEPRIARIPLTTKAKTILSKYYLPDGSLLPFISDQKYNDYLKELFELVGLTRIVTIKDPKTRMGKQIRLCDYVSSHMARRNFVGGLYQKNAKDAIIASMSGHVENSKSFSRYRSIDRESQNEAIKLIE